MQQRLNEFSDYVYASIYVTLKIAALVELCKTILHPGKVEQI